MARHSLVSRLNQPQHRSLPTCITEGEGESGDWSRFYGNSCRANNIAVKIIKTDTATQKGFQCSQNFERGRYVFVYQIITSHYENVIHKSRLTQPEGLVTHNFLVRDFEITWFQLWFRDFDSDFMISTKISDYSDFRFLLSQTSEQHEFSSQLWFHDRFLISIIIVYRFLISIQISDFNIDFWVISEISIDFQH